MKRIDFDLIIAESISHTTKSSFFEAKRNEFECIPEEYFKGLTESYKRLYKETHETDYNWCNNTELNGKVVYGRTKDADCEFLERSFPHKKIVVIDVLEHYFRLTAEDMETVLPYLEIYLLSVNKDKGKEPKIVRPFFKYLLHAKPDVVAEICYSIFNKNESPKDYAVMTCLLSEKGFVVVRNKGRKDFFEAWYRYINMPLPKRSNFAAINKNIVDKAANGFVFINEDDPDYLNLKEAFDKALVNSGI